MTLRSIFIASNSLTEKLGKMWNYLVLNIIFLLGNKATSFKLNEFCNCNKIQNEEKLSKSFKQSVEILAKSDLENYFHYVPYLWNQNDLLKSCHCEKSAKIDGNFNSNHKMHKRENQYEKNHYFLIEVFVEDFLKHVNVKSVNIFLQVPMTRETGL